MRRCRHSGRARRRRRRCSDYANHLRSARHSETRAAGGAARGEAGNENRGAGGEQVAVATEACETGIE
jgi:hypothetical protein